MRYFTFSILLIFLVACGNQENTKTNIPNFNIANEFGIDSTELVYQYYQKYGFAETCEDIRMVSKPNEPLDFEKTLPITKEDLEIINAFENKADSLMGNKINLSRNTRDVFYDIEQEFLEFGNPDSIRLSLTKGYYQISTSNLMNTLKVYDSNSGLLYIEVQRCDGM